MCILIDSHLEDHNGVRTILSDEHLHDFNRHECKHGIRGHYMVRGDLLDRVNMK